MGRVGQESDFKSQLVTEICNISARAITCDHRPIKSYFIDWYLLLRVEEDAAIDVIRKQYLKLVLQLHPDKNKHPKAEIAFKLVSEAYACLSDDAKRRAFNLERWKRLCIECNRFPYTSRNPPSNPNAAKLKGLNPADRSRSNKILRGLKEIRDRFKEEARVIESCLKDNTPSRKESPLFNPSDYKFQGYPHLRTRIFKKPENLWYLRTGSILNCEQGRGKWDSPVFEIRSERGAFKGRSTCLSL